MAIWQDLVDDHGFPAGYTSVRRFVSTVRQQPALMSATVPLDPGGGGALGRNPSTSQSTEQLQVLIVAADEFAC